MIKNCKICGTQFDAKGRITICSELCKKEYNRKRQYDFAIKTGKFTLKQKKCKICDEPFETYKGGKITCSDECSRKNHLQTIAKFNSNSEKVKESKKVRERERYRKKVGFVEGAMKTCVKCGKGFPQQHKRKYCDECRNSK